MNKSTLTFTDYIENNEGSITSIEIIALMDGEQTLRHISPKYDLTVSRESKRTALLRMGLSEIATKAMLALKADNKAIPGPENMVLSDKLSFFTVKQSVNFNNDVHEAGRDINVLLEAIW